MNGFDKADELELKKLIISIKNLVKRRWLLFVVVFAAVLSILYTITPPKTYVSSYNIIFNIEDNPGLYDVAVEQCNDIANLIENLNYNELSRLLQIDFPLTSISSLSVTSYSGSTNNNYLPTSINLKLSHTDTTNTYEFVKKVVDYLKKNDFISEWHNGMNKRRDEIYKQAKLEMEVIDQILEQELNLISKIEGLDGILEQRYNLKYSIISMEFKNKILDSFYLATDKNNSTVKQSSFERLIKIISIGFLVSFLLISVLESIRFIRNITSGN